MDRNVVGSIYGRSQHARVNQLCCDAKLEAQHWAEHVSLIFHSALRKLNTEPSIGASPQISTAKQNTDRSACRFVVLIYMTITETAQVQINNVVTLKILQQYHGLDDHLGTLWPWSYGFITTYAISAYHHWCCECETKRQADLSVFCFAVIISRVHSIRRGLHI
jgi:hypothetical protein